jgi:hypothetical protein
MKNNMSTKPSPLAQRVIDLLSEGENRMCLWSVANALYDNCMQMPKAGNGIRIANLRRVAENCDDLVYYLGVNDAASVALKVPVQKQ